MNIQVNINVNVTGDDAQADGSPSVTQGFTLQESCDIGHQGVDLFSAGKLTLPATQEVQEVCMGGVAEAAGLFVRVNGPAVLCLNGSIDGLLLRPIAGADQASIYFAGKVTQATLQSGSLTADVDVVYQVWGSEAAP